MPLSRSSSMVSISCFIERAKRSSFQTISVSPLRANASASCNAGRSVTAPDILLGENLLAPCFGERVPLQGQVLAGFTHEVLEVEGYACLGNCESPLALRGAVVS